MNTEISLVGIATIAAMLASGGALYVSMKVKSSIDTLKLELHNDFEGKFMQQKDCVAYEAMRKEMETAYRTQTRGDITGIQVEIKKDKDDLNIALKGILAAIKEAREEVPRRR